MVPSATSRRSFSLVVYLGILTELGLATTVHPIFKQVELVFGPVRSVRGHSRLRLTGEGIVDALSILILIRRIRHVLVVIEQYIHPFHVLDVHGPEQGANIAGEGNLTDVLH